MPKLKTLQKSRNSAFKNQAGRCYYCKCEMWLENKDAFAQKYSLSSRAAERFRCTAEHLVARSEHGKDTKDNIVAACTFCNMNRHKRKKPPVPARYKKDIENRIRKGKWFPQELRTRMSL